MKPLLLLAALLTPLATSAQTTAANMHLDGLGSISFPNSGNDAAQLPFYRGVLLLHSFEFGPARAAFREAQGADPSFALAYWGEAMAHNYPLWRSRDLTDGAAVLARLGPSADDRRSKAGTEREAMYLDAVETLYADGSKEEQDLAYLSAMERLHAAFPADDEARTFYSLAILGSLNGERDFATYMRAAATASPVFQRNPDHPGAAHYLIHSFDDPVHAPLGLPAAEAYSDIAPNASHAQHMTSHIFVALGMWERVVTANLRAMDVQDADRAQRGQPPNACGHYSSWRHYGHLMLGELEEAEMLMDRCHEQATAGQGSWFYFAAMRARHVVDTGDWTLAGRWLADPPAQPELENDASVWGGAEFSYVLTNAYAALQEGDTGPASAMLARDWGGHPGRSLQLDQLRGLQAIRAGEIERGLALLAESAASEATLPFEFGPPLIVKPGYELLGEARVANGRDSRSAFAQAALRTPGRPLAAGPSQPAGSH